MYAPADIRGSAQPWFLVKDFEDDLGRILLHLLRAAADLERVRHQRLSVNRVEIVLDGDRVQRELIENDGDESGRKSVGVHRQDAAPLIDVSAKLIRVRQRVFDAHRRRSPGLRVRIQKVDELIGLDEAVGKRVDEMTLPTIRPEPQVNADAGLDEDASFADSAETGDFQEERLELAGATAAFDPVRRVDEIFGRNSSESASLSSDDHP